MEDMNSFSKIGEGQDAEVYAIEDNKVLKLFRNSNDEKVALREMEILKTMYRSGLLVPKVHEYVNISSRPGFVMERITGNSILSTVEKRPYIMLRVSKMFGQYHSDIHKFVAPVEIPLLKEGLERSITAVHCLDDEIIQYTLKLLSELPDGNCICHGDYNPSNVIINGDSPVFLDWGGVSRGDAASDVAHTLLILKNGQFPPNTSFLFKLALKLGRNAFANIYFRTYQHYNQLDLSVLSKWEMVRAVGRLSYGGEEERPALVKYIKKFYENKGNNRVNLF